MHSDQAMTEIDAAPEQVGKSEELMEETVAENSQSVVTDVPPEMNNGETEPDSQSESFVVENANDNALPEETENTANELPSTEPPATEPLATEPPATEPQATETPATEPGATEEWTALDENDTSADSAIAPPGDGGQETSQMDVSGGLEQSSQESAEVMGDDIPGENKDDTEADKGETEEGIDASGQPRRSKDAAKYWSMVDKNRQDFTSWTQLIAIVEKEGKMEGLKEVYDEFLLYYPFCYGYWKKLADFMGKETGEEAAIKVYEDAVVAIGLSIDLWVAYLEFYMSCERSEEEIRALFLRAINSCGLEFKSDKVWDMYIDWETKNSRYTQITEIYRRLLTTPTKCYDTHYENAKQHIDSHEPGEIIAESELPEVRIRATEIVASRKEEPEDKDLPPGLEDTDENIFEVNVDDPEVMNEKLKSAIKAVLHEQFDALFTENEKEVKLRWEFEEAIKRPYFHNKPLDAVQLKNWRKYLDFEIENGGEDRVIVLFERCVIACAQYEEFWLKYTTYLEGLGRHLDVRNVYTRACRQHLPYKASIHITWAFYEERQGDYEQALYVISNIELQTPDNMCVLNHRLNLLRRHGDDLCEAFTTYIERKGLAEESVRLLISKYARYLLKIKGEPDKACEVLTKAIESHPAHEAFFNQLLDVEYQRQPLDEEKVLAVFDLVNSSSLSADVKQKFYSRRYEFIDDLGSDVNRLYTMYQEHEEAAIAAKEKKRALSASDKAYVDPKKAKTAQAAYQNNGTAANYNQQYQQQGQYYGTQATGWNQQYYQQTPDYSQYGYTPQQQQQYAQQGYGTYTGYDYSGYY